MGQAPKRLPLSGSEPKFTQKMWGRAVGINNNNCYAMICLHLFPFDLSQVL